MYLLKFLIKNPLGIYLIWLALLAVFYLAGLNLLHWSVDDGEEERYSFLGKAFVVGELGVIVIGFISPVIYWDWYKKYSFVPVILPLGLSMFLAFWMIDTYLGRL